MGDTYVPGVAPDGLILSARRSPLVRTFLCLMLALAGLVRPAGTVDARPLEQVQQTKNLRVVVYRDNPPFSYMENDKPKGIDVDIAHELAKSLGVELEILARMTGEDVDDDLRFNIWRGPFSEGGVGDVMLHIPIDREMMARNNLTAISNAYFRKSVALAIHPDRIPPDATYDIFKKEKVGVQYATIADYFLLRYDDGALINNVVHYTKPEVGIRQFIDKETSALMGVRSDIEGMLHERGHKATFITPPTPGMSQSSWVVGTAVKEDSRDLGYAIGNALDELRDSGRLQAIFEAHGVTYVPPVEPER